MVISAYLLIMEYCITASVFSTTVPIYTQYTQLELVQLVGIFKRVAILYSCRHTKKYCKMQCYKYLYL